MRDVAPADDYSADIIKVKDEISAIDSDSDEAPSLFSSLHAELARLRKLQAEAKPAKVEPRIDGDRTIGDVWESMDAPARRRWLLSRKGSGWLPGQDKASVKVFPRDETGGWPVIVDIGDYTDLVVSLGGPDYSASLADAVEVIRAEVAELERKHGFRINPDGSHTELNEVK